MDCYRAPPIPCYRIDSPPDQSIVFSWVPDRADVNSVADHITQLDMRASSPFFTDTSIHQGLTHLALNRLVKGSCIPPTVKHLFIHNRAGLTLPPVENYYFHVSNCNSSEPLIPTEHSVFSWNIHIPMTDLNPDVYDLAPEPITAFGLPMLVAKYAPKIEPGLNPSS